MLTCLVLACNTEQKDDTGINVIYFDTGKSIEEYDMKDLTDGTFSIIPLETTDECPVSKIDKIEIKDKRIYIMDQLAQSVYVFDMDGKYLNKIHKRGQGPGEYNNLSYMALTDSSIIIIDHFTGKQINYSIPSLKFISEERIFEKLWATEIFYLSGNVYYINNWSDSEAGKFRLFSKRYGSDKFEKYLPFEEDGPISLGINGPAYSINGNEASLIYSGCDTVFRLRDGKIFPEYVVKFKDKKVKYSSGKVENIFNDNPPGRVIGINRINESDRYLFLEISMIINGNIPSGPGNYGDYICIHDKSDHSTVICPDNIIYNTMFDDAYGIGRIIDNKIIFWYDAYVLPLSYPEKLAKRTFRKEEYGGRLKEVIANLADDDNPVLFIYGLK
jgi:hypothetical protein